MQNLQGKLQPALCLKMVQPFLYIHVFSKLAGNLVTLLYLCWGGWGAFEHLTKIQ